MPFTPRLHHALCALAGILLLSGCAATRGTPPTTAYDLGPLPAATGMSATAGTIAPITVADVTSPAWMDSQSMVFRLDYAGPQQPQPYAASRWSMPPPQLLGQRIKERLAAAGAIVLSASDGALNIPVLRIDADDFSQQFSSATTSQGHVALRASVFSGRTLVAQKRFEQVRPAPSADASGGAIALASATDALIGDMMSWLTTLPTKK